MKNYVTEFIGTFFLVLTIGLCVTPEAGSLDFHSIISLVRRVDARVSFGGTAPRSSHITAEITPARILQRGLELHPVGFPRFGTPS